MRYPKPLTIDLPNVNFPSAVLLHENRSYTPESEKDFEIGELYIPSSKDTTKLSPRRDISPTIFNLSRRERRTHSSNSESGLSLRRQVLDNAIKNKDTRAKPSIFNNTNTRSHPIDIPKRKTWDLNGRRTDVYYFN